MRQSSLASAVHGGTSFSRWREVYVAGRHDTRQLLRQRALDDPASDACGYAAMRLRQAHSEFGHRVFTQSPNGFDPYLDPQALVPRDHIEECAVRVGLPAEQLDATLAELSKLLGWDVTVGARPKPAPKKRAKRTPRRKQ
ncbi:MAG: hypothetical protein B7Z55_05540 [Planctomycetales bacterium 12-60-4]|nr:MAG: hypothetical protein B7Z55_05540 [Planctomycetales bacterium 12-60-4]